MTGLACLVVLVILAVLSFGVAWLLMVLWNVVVPAFGGPHITFWLAYAIYWFLALIGGFFKTTSTK